MGEFLKNIVRHRVFIKAGMILFILVIILIMLWGRAYYGSMNAYRQGEIYLESRQYLKAVTHFDRSIHWYTPFNPYVERSAERLWNIGKNAEQKGDTKLALIAFRTIRQGFYAASHVAVPGKSWIARCDIKINDLMALEKRIGRGGHEAQSKMAMPQNQECVPPRIFWSIILEIGFLGWVGSILCLIMFPLRNREGRKKRKISILIWIGFVVVFFTLWIVGMMRA